MNMNKRRFRIGATGDVSEAGVDRGPRPGRLITRRPQRPKVGDLTTFAIKWPGHNYWSGVGQPQGYARVTTCVYQGRLRERQANEVEYFEEVVELLCWEKKGKP